MELKFGNKLHNLCVEWVVKNAMNRPYLADMEPKDVAHFFIDGHNIYKLDENSHRSFVEMMRTEVTDKVYERDKLVPK